MPPIIPDYTTDGRRRVRGRRTSRLAIASLVVGLLLCAGAAFVWYVYSNPPPPDSGLEGVGWFFGVMAFFGLLFFVTIILAPLGLLLAAGAFAKIRQQPQQLRGRVIAAMAILLNIAPLVAVVTAAVILNKWSAQFAPTPADYALSNEHNRMSQIVEACRRYAESHEGHYPPDLRSISVPGDDLADCDYYGTGVTDTKGPAATARADLVVVSKRVIRGRHVIGIEPHVYAAPTSIDLDDPGLESYMVLAGVRDTRGTTEPSGDGALQ